MEGSASIGDALRARGLAERVVRAHRGDAVPRALGDVGARALLVMGGPMGVYEADRYPHLADEIRLIQSALKEGAPILGVCLGSQLLAAALGARVAPGPSRELGWRDVELRDAAKTDALFGGCPPRFAPIHWHGDVFDLPQGAVALARSEQTEHQAFRAGERAWGILFHLEMRALEIEAMASAFAGDLAAAGMRADDILGDAPARVAAAAPIGARVFGAWAEIALTG